MRHQVFLLFGQPVRNSEQRVITHLEFSLLDKPESPDSSRRSILSFDPLRPDYKMRWVGFDTARRRHSARSSHTCYYGETWTRNRRRRLPRPHSRRPGGGCCWRAIRSGRTPSITSSASSRSFPELHGDRHFGDDPAIVAGFAFFEGKPVVVVAEQKGRDTKQKLYRNFGMPKPEGYRKAIRVMQVAAKFGRPVITLLDTPGAYPGHRCRGARAGGSDRPQPARDGAACLPVITVCIGEGGSGGALALGVGNRVYMLENAVYSVISPESCAAIIWRDSAKAELAAEALKVTAPDLLGFGLIDEIIPEPPGGAQENVDAAAELLKAGLRKGLSELVRLTSNEIVQQRYTKFRKMGNFFA